MTGGPPVAEFVRRVEACLEWARRMDAAGSIERTRAIVERLEEIRTEALEAGTVHHAGDGRMGLIRWWGGDWGVDKWGPEGERLLDEVCDLQNWFDEHWREFPPPP